MEGGGGFFASAAAIKDDSGGRNRSTLSRGGGGFFSANALEIFVFLVAFDDNDGGGGRKFALPNDNTGTPTLLLSLRAWASTAAYRLERSLAPFVVDPLPYPRSSGWASPHTRTLIWQGRTR